MEIVGDWVDTDPGYGQQYRTVQEVDMAWKEIQEECEFQTVRVHRDGRVELLNRGVPVASAQMSSHHADAHLVIGDPAWA